MTHGMHSHHEITKEARQVRGFYELLPRANDAVYAEFRDKPATRANYIKLYSAIFGHTPEETPDPLANIGLKKLAPLPQATPEWMLEECTCRPDGRGSACPFCRSRSKDKELEF